MTPSRIDHVGIAVRSLKESIHAYERLLGTRCAGVEEVAGEKVKTAFFRIGETRIELLESTAPDGPIARFIDKRGEGIHHIALAVNDLRADLRGLEADGFALIDREPRPGAEGCAIAFLHPKSTGGVLIELCQTEERQR